MVYFRTYINGIIIKEMNFYETLIYWQPIKSEHDSPLIYLVTPDYKIVNKTNIFWNIQTFKFESYKYMFQNIDSRIWQKWTRNWENGKRSKPQPGSQIGYQLPLLVTLDEKVRVRVESTYNL